jgi:hypothetical protein
LKSRGWRTPAGAGVLVVVVAVLALVVFHDGGGGDTDCSTFRVTPELWAKADYNRRLRLREGLEDCDRITGQPDTQVIAQLGPPDGGGTAELDYTLPFPDKNGRQIWRIRVGGDGKVTGSSLR